MNEHSMKDILEVPKQMLQKLASISILFFVFLIFTEDFSGEKQTPSLHLLNSGRHPFQNTMLTYVFI